MKRLKGNAMKEDLNVLILEDIPSDAEFAQRELKTVLRSYMVKVVDTEEEFVQALKTFKPDLIISDYLMPEFDGLSALKIRQDKCPFTPFVILTSSVNEEIAVECMKAGADDYVIKEHIKRLGPAVLNAMDKKNIEQERKQAEDAIKDAELRYRTVADFTYNWEYWENPDKSLNYVSPVCEKISGYSVEQFIKNPQLLDEIVLDVDRDIWNNHKHESKRQIHSEMEIQFRIKRKDGTTVWIEHSCRPILDERGTFLGYRASNRDVTERKLAEKELNAAHKEIKQLRDKLQAENIYLRKNIETNDLNKDIIGNSNQIKETVAKTLHVAPMNTTVLLLGETGTGKELLTRGIHNASLRKDKTLITVNCAAIPDSLIESELFGHEKGAFTDANSRKIGLFEVANGSTIFLDEIAELNLNTQAKLLRVIENREILRLGNTNPIKIDVRIIAATNQDLKALIEDKKFRQDLFYRLNVYPIVVPPLRLRKDDIPLLVEKFVDDFNRQMGKKVINISKTSLNRLVDYAWPGNIRELKNIIERSMIISYGSSLNVDISSLKKKDSEVKEVVKLEDLERNHIEKVLHSTFWKISGKNGAAEILGLHPNTLNARIKKLGIKKPK